VEKKHSEFGGFFFFQEVIPQLSLGADPALPQQQATVPKK